jgi:hypothetical protein
MATSVRATASRGCHQVAAHGDAAGAGPAAEHGSNPADQGGRSGTTGGGGTLARGSGLSAATSDGGPWSLVSLLHQRDNRLSP